MHLASDHCAHAETFLEQIYGFVNFQTTNSIACGCMQLHAQGFKQVCSSKLQILYENQGITLNLKLVSEASVFPLPQTP